jgi:hypothetical protein
MLVELKKVLRKEVKSAKVVPYLVSTAVETWKKY